MYTAYINFENSEVHGENDVAKAFEIMRYFDINRKPCRALKYNKAMLGQNKETLNKERNLFVKNVPKSQSEIDVHNLYKAYGDILSLKVSKNEDHSSRGYGFVCYANAEEAEKALAQMKGNTECTAVKF